MGRVRTCFASSVVCSDEFRDLPPVARLLYFELGFIADSDGAIDGIRGAARMAGATMDDVDALSAAGYLLWVDGVPFISHWLVNNKTDRLNYRPGGHPEQLSKLIRENGKPYNLSDLYQSDGSLTSDAKQSKDKPSEADLIQADQSESNLNEGKGNAHAREPTRIRCPQCGFECAATTEPDGVTHAWCPQCGDFELREGREQWTN